MLEQVVIYTASESDYRIVRQAIRQPDASLLPPEPLTYDDLQRERKALAHARCIIFAFRVADLPRWIERARRIAQRVDAVPRILVTDHAVEGASLLGGLRVNAVVTIRRLRAGPIDLPYLDPLGGTFERWARELEGSDIHSDLITGLAYALRQTPDHPVRSPMALEDATGLNCVHLSKRVGAVVGGQYRLEDFLTALVVVSVHRRRRVGITWAGVATDLGFHEKTIRSKIQHWLGIKAGALRQVDLTEVLERFEVEFLRPLLVPRRGVALSEAFPHRANVACSTGDTEAR